MLMAPYLEAGIPRRNTHPVILAKYMLTLAITLQTPRRVRFLGLSHPQGAIMRRLMAATGA